MQNKVSEETMQEKMYDKLGDRAAELFKEAQIKALHRETAKEKIKTVLEAMRSENKILMLTKEEERMLRAFRAFQLSCKPGAVFKWQTQRVELGKEGR